MIFEPMVWTMRQPPNRVPRRHGGLAGQHHPRAGTWKLALQVAVGVEQDGDDPHGLLGVVAAVAEGVERGGDELQAAEGAVGGAGVRRTNSHDTISTSSSASRKPIAGDMKMAAPVLITPPQTTADRPALAMPAPISPPTRACELEDGMPAIQVTTFQTMAPIRAPKITRSSITATSMMPAPRSGPRAGRRTGRR